MWGRTSWGKVDSLLSGSICAKDSRTDKISSAFAGILLLSLAVTMFFSLANKTGFISFFIPNLDVIFSIASSGPASPLKRYRKYGAADLP